MKKIINNRENIIQEMLRGFYFEHKETVCYEEKHNIIYRKKIEDDQVAIISGGGSGHEPAHFGYVGEGMLTASINGSIFTPPTAEQVLEAIRLVDRNQGILLIIKNFKADVESFLLAESMAKAEGRIVDHIIVNDDVSVEEISYQKRKRGVAGTIFVHKILGAAAREGYSLETLKEMGQSVIHNLHTLGVALTPAQHPFQEQLPFTLKDDEVYFGIGIHGEKGYRKEKFTSSERLAVELFNKLKSIYRWREGDAFAILINGLGATPLMEQYIFANDIRRLMQLENLRVEFVKVGTLLTSLDMKGISLSFLKIEEEKWVKWLKAKVNVSSW